MKKSTKVTIVTTLGAVALGATIFGAVPAMAAGNAGGRGGSLQDGLCQAASTMCSTITAADDSATCVRFSDTDNDGVCDTCGTSHTCRNDTDGDGVCDVCGGACTAGTYAHHGHGTGYGHCGR